MSELTHIGADGRARMVDVGDKSITEREAVARGELSLKTDTLQLALSGGHKKGNPLAVAELAGIMAAKKCADLIPLCHPLPLTGIKLEITPNEAASTLDVIARVKTRGQTGVEMEALTAVSVACLTLYDMLKSSDKSMIIQNIELHEKIGGKSGHYRKAE